MTEENWVKYPRTPHLPWSPGYTSDDILLTTADMFMGKKVLITEKMDGECTTLYPNKIHARSIDSKDHESQHWLKRWWAERSYLLPKGIRICGENVYAQHTIAYNELPSYFLGFSVWASNMCLSAQETWNTFRRVDVDPVPLLYYGDFDPDILPRLFTGISKCGGEQEGYVIRNIEAFKYEDFDKNVAKYVRANHVQTDTHWKAKVVIPNKLKE